MTTDQKTYTMPPKLMQDTHRLGHKMHQKSHDTTETGTPCHIKIPFVQHSRHYQNLTYPNPHTLTMHTGRKEELQKCIQNDNNPL